MGKQTWRWSWGAYETHHTWCTAIPLASYTAFMTHKHCVKWRDYNNVTLVHGGNLALVMWVSFILHLLLFGCIVQGTNLYIVFVCLWILSKGRKNGGVSVEMTEEEFLQLFLASLLVLWRKAPKWTLQFCFGKPAAGHSIREAFKADKKYLRIHHTPRKLPCQSSANAGIFGNRIWQNHKIL